MTMPLEPGHHTRACLFASGGWHIFILTERMLAWQKNLPITLKLLWQYLAITSQIYASYIFFCIELVVGWVPLSGWMACTHNGAFSAYPSRAEATIAHSCCVPGRWYPANNISHIYSNECCHLYWNRAIVSRFLWPKHCGCDIRSHALCHVAPTVDTFATQL